MVVNIRCLTHILPNFNLELFLGNRGDARLRGYAELWKQVVLSSTVCGGAKIRKFSTVSLTH